MCNILGKPFLKSSSVGNQGQSVFLTMSVMLRVPIVYECSEGKPSFAI